MKVVWTRQALGDLAEVRAYIAERDPRAAKRMVERILCLVETHLPATPHMGRPGRVDDTRELVVTGTPLIVPYRVRARTIHILRVYHGARRWPDGF